MIFKRDINQLTANYANLPDTAFQTWYFTRKLCYQKIFPDDFSVANKRRKQERTKYQIADDFLGQF